MLHTCVPSLEAVHMLLEERAKATTVYQIQYHQILSCLPYLVYGSFPSQVGGCSYPHFTDEKIKTQSI